MSYTPGPWAVDDGARYGSKVLAECGTVADVFSALPFGVGHRQRQSAAVRNANARLIAAAPDMLEAIRAYIEERSGDADELLRAAWAKAHGKA